MHPFNMRFLILKGVSSPPDRSQQAAAQQLRLTEEMPYLKAQKQQLQVFHSIKHTHVWLAPSIHAT
eukprot:1389419-Pyramimonas_sp.AAC.1